MRKIATLLAAMFICLGAMAQDNKAGRPRFTPEEFEQKLHAFVASEAAFSPKEEEAFFRLHKEMRQKQHKVQKRIQKLKRPDTENAGNKEMAQRVIKIAELEEECADIKKDYYEKMAREIPGKKLHKAILAEDAFHRQMLRKFSPKREHRRIEMTTTRKGRR